ncbi:Hexitol phosphatase A [Baekduia alba]|uniref:HAD-IA family hydrolase n=1 Tax=Baekduia alba TaxID=2997333 RepID=UPI00233FDFB5|nr:HAD-IA family hydrolase [Baekduia alba]WCB94774.1 Hexitol phosphatase A [Baekduia alba]
MTSLSPVAVLSDLDGVLVDSGDSIEVTWSTWARGHGIDPEVLRGRIHGRPAGAVIREVAPHLDADAEAAAVSQMDIDGPPAKLLPGAMELLRGGAGVPVAVVTSCPDALAHVRLTAVDLPVPEVLVTSDRVSVGKPDPEGYRLAASELGVDVGGCVVFEDAPAGVAAGVAAGAVVVGILTTHAADELVAAGAIEVAATVADALALFTAADRAE